MKSAKAGQKSNSKNTFSDDEDIDSEISEKKENLYSLLNLDKNATKSQIKKSYRELVFKYHPDKNKNDPEAAEKFSNIARAYKILSNDETRKVYDETGEYDLENQPPIDITNTLNYFRKIFSEDDIINFEKKYINSAEEEEDLIEFYNLNNGNIRKILENIPCSKNNDVERFKKKFEELFKNKKLKKNKNYEESKNNIILLKEDAKEAKEAQETLNKLSQQIMLNKKKRNYDDYLGMLMNKYCDEDEKEDFVDIPDEEFEKIANDMKNGKKSGKNGSNKNGKNKKKKK